MIKADEYEVRVLRAFDVYHRDDIIKIAPWRLEWLKKHGFVDVAKKQRKPRLDTDNATQQR